MHRHKCYSIVYTCCWTWKLPELLLSHVPRKTKSENRKIAKNERHYNSLKSDRFQWEFSDEPNIKYSNFSKCWCWFEKWKGALIEDSFCAEKFQEPLLWTPYAIIPEILEKDWKLRTLPNSQSKCVKGLWLHGNPTPLIAILVWILVPYQIGLFCNFWMEVFDMR